MMVVPHRNQPVTKVSQILPGKLDQGACVSTEAAAMYDMVVSAARECVPPTGRGYESIHLPMDDSPWDWRRHGDEAARVVGLARVVAQAVKQGKRVLVVCQMGLNRSGLINGLALTHLGYTPDEAVQLVRGRHPLALSNRTFHQAVYGLAPKTSGVMRYIRRRGARR